MHWVIQNNIFKEKAYDQLLEVLDRFQLPYSEHKIIPFLGTLVPINIELNQPVDGYEDQKLTELSGPVICMGSYSLRHAAKKYGWTPGVFDLIETGSFTECMKHWGNLMLNSDSTVTALKDAKWVDGERFVRPTNDSKQFAGLLIDCNEFDQWQYQICTLNADYGNNLSPDTVIQIAKPKIIYAEYRCWIIDDQIVTMSLYKRSGRAFYQNMDDSQGDDAREFAKSVLLNRWKPSSAFCLDVCETSEGWRIVEVNTLNSSGFYHANLNSLVVGLEDAFG